MSDEYEKAWGRLLWVIEWQRRQERKQEYALRTAKRAAQKPRLPHVDRRRLTCLRMEFRAQV